MRGFRCGSFGHGWKAMMMLGVQESMISQPDQWAVSLFLQDLFENEAAEHLESLLTGGLDGDERGLLKGKDLTDTQVTRILRWLEREILHGAQPQPVAVTRDTMECHEQLSTPIFSDVVGWIFPRFRTESSPVRERAVVSRLIEAYQKTVLPVGWHGFTYRSTYQWFWHRSRLRSAAALAHWAYYFEKSEAMSPEQRLWSLSELARWWPAQALREASSDLVANLPSLTDADYERGDLRKAMGLWLSKNKDALSNDVVSDPVLDQMIAELSAFARHLRALIRSWPNWPPGDSIESAMAAKVNGIASIKTEAFKQRNTSIWMMHREHLVSAYFSKLVSWGVDSPYVPSPEEVHFPVAHRNSFDFHRVGNNTLRQHAWVEERIVRRLMGMLINEHAYETRQTSEQVVLAIHTDKSFRFSVSRDTFNTWYYKAVKDVAARLAEEEAYDYAWRIGGAAITLMFNVPDVVNPTRLTNPVPHPEELQPLVLL
ncbi:hypothetical protein GNI_037530 [Gregarina niphandrodes]|uniref:Uncharacterized protein n=1 Tax=Gregarina niphandrodes TaxID=110365 RepID=A0A023BAJ4_GRENI|nr:hypothetical protein GNI_037530 [Gregarina niphandrodes]EZG78355.1 hypothetical protein GNI_037530 [Gregarina niphandrodes]|eukprot:XP_011129335.1 hypothetical protein GNI_037530 [Gregarina niphandrodes]